MTAPVSVSQLNAGIKALLDSHAPLKNVSVRGETSNYKVYPSGHHYFTLKDAESSLRCVMFRSAAAKLDFRPESGQTVIAHGQVQVYERDGAYQLYCRALNPDGEGDLRVRFERLKAKLAAEGLFDERRKRPLPKFPRAVGLVTSPAGAAVRDMLRILGARFPLAEVFIYPSAVQGAEAPPELVRAIEIANAHGIADVLIVGRGGGSAEDLAAFNDERVVRALAASKIPAISAVGHEPDVTLCDYAADLRAATPSNAAELAVPDAQDLRQHLDACHGRMSSGLSRRLEYARRQASPDRLNRAFATEIELKRRSAALRAGKLDALSPLKVMSRGYASVGVRSVKEVKPGDGMDVRLIDGVIKTTVAGVKAVRKRKNDV